MNIDLGKATNKGTALMKFAHQFQPQVILQDEFVGWFFDDAVAQSLKEDCLNLNTEPKSDSERFQQIAYWYTILREKYGDELIEEAIESNCKQLLLLGAGYDTRFFRIAAVQEKSIATFEVDLPETIADKQQYLTQNLEKLPPELTLVPLDFNQDNLSDLFNFGFDAAIATAYIWQGVSYYLPRESVPQVLDFIQSCMTSNSVLMFDCCSPLMTFKNNQIPGIAASIDRLAEIGEPFLFGMYADEMREWLETKGFRDIKILQQDDLQEKFLHKRTLPNNMWYVVTARGNLD